MKESILLLACIMIHLSLDIFYPIFSFSSYNINTGISSYHFVYLLYPITEDGFQFALYIPDFLIWIIDFSILLVCFLYTFSKFAGEDTIFSSYEPKKETNTLFISKALSKLLN